MVLVVYMMHGHGLRNKNAFPVTAREDQGKALLADNVVAKGVIHDAVHC